VPRLRSKPAAAGWPVCNHFLRTAFTWQRAPTAGKSGKFGDLRRRLWFLLLALVVYRIGAHIPVPGIDPIQLASCSRASRAAS
jgi:hypothetical protein